MINRKEPLVVEGRELPGRGYTNLNLQSELRTKPSPTRRPTMRVQGPTWLTHRRLSGAEPGEEGSGGWEFLSDRRVNLCFRQKQKEFEKSAGFQRGAERNRAQTGEKTAG